MTRRGPALLAALATLAVLSGCSAAPGSAQAVHLVQTYRGTAVAQKTASSSDEHPTVFWITGHRLVALSAYGSSNCPPVPDTVVVTSPTEIDLHLKDYDTSCTADLGATTSEFALPSSVSRTEPVQVYLTATGNATALLRLAPDPAIAEHRQ